MYALADELAAMPAAPAAPAASEREHERGHERGPDRNWRRAESVPSGASVDTERVQPARRRPPQ
jgi:hypothetical protein